MAKGSNQKLKLMYLADILKKETDEQHAITVQDMIRELEQYGITAERKSIYDDLEVLKQYGLDIVSRKSKTYDYFLASRDFELAELKLLGDAVQSSKFITLKKSKELIKKLSALTSRHEAKQLERQVYVLNRVKTLNESIYYNVDELHTAIAAKKQIAFKYFEYTVDKTKNYRKNGEKYIACPCALTWDDENYYLITYNPKYGSHVHYRVDKMTDIEILDIPAELSADQSFNIAEYSKKIFSMFGGEELNAVLQFDNSFVGVVIDRFGKDIFLQKTDENHFKLYQKVIVSPAFCGWLFQFGGMVKVISPQRLADMVKNKAKEVSEMYE